MVEAKDPAEPLDALDGVRRRFGTVVLLDQPIIDPLRMHSDAPLEEITVGRDGLAIREALAAPPEVPNREMSFPPDLRR